MVKPDESFEGQPADDALGADSKRSRPSIGATEMSMLKPLGQQNVPLTFLLGYHSSWYGRFLALGIGALGMMTAILVSAIFVGINNPLPGVDLAINGPADIEQLSFDIFSPGIPPVAAARLEPVRGQLRSKLVRPEVRSVGYKPRRESRSSSRLRIGKFIPTTLVIYAENGVVKRRIEPWL